MTTLEQVKTYVQNHLTALQYAGFATLAVLCIGAHNKINNGGIFTFKNPYKAVVNKFNDKISEVAKKNEKNARTDIETTYSESNLIKRTDFAASVKGITNSSNQLESDFINELKDCSSESEKETIKALGSVVTYADLIGTGKVYATNDDFMKIVAKIKAKKLSNVTAQPVKVSDITDVLNDTNFQIENGKLALKDTK